MNIDAGFKMYLLAVSEQAKRQQQRLNLIVTEKEKITMNHTVFQTDE